MIYGKSVGGVGIERTYVLVDESGNEVTAVLSDTDLTLDATAHDIREGKTAATAQGVTVGDKYIPAYHTTESAQYIPAGDEMIISQLAQGDRYDFTKLQAIVCPYNTSFADSVAAEKVVIDGKVYAVGSTDVLATVTIDADTKTISLGITNTGTVPCLIRYFTYKEES